MSSTNRRSALSKVTLALLSAGVVLTAAYFVLDALDVGGVGEPTDIGGGFILLAGYVLVGIGVVSGGINWMRHRRLS